MKLDDIPVKTEKGLEVIQTRSLSLSPHTRNLLIMINRKSVRDLLETYETLSGGVEGAMEALDELLRLNLITVAATASCQKAISEPAGSPPEPYDAAKQYLVDFVHSLMGDDNAELINQIHSCAKRDEFMEIVNECREMVASIAGKKKADQFVEGMLTLLPN
jgi:hypothetical protein